MGAKYKLETHAFALAAATAYYPVRINAGAARKVILREATFIDGKAAATDQGILVEIVTGETDTTGTTTTPTPMGNASASAASGEVVGCAASSTPVVKDAFTVPAGGAFTQRYDDDEGHEVPASTAIYLKVTAAELRASGVCLARLVFEEV